MPALQGAARGDAHGRRSHGDVGRAPLVVSSHATKRRRRANRSSASCKGGLDVAIAHREREAHDRDRLRWLCGRWIVGGGEP
jgi:hypothetical protein